MTVPAPRGFAGHASQYRRATATIDGVRIPYLKGGYGPPLLYLHGLGGWGQWERHIFSLAITNTVYYPQLPGWGEGEVPEGITSVRDYAGFMRRFLDEVGVSTCDVVGHSFGGWVALYLVLDHPTSVQRLILIDPMGLDVPDAPATDLTSLDEDGFALVAFATTAEVLITGDFGNLVEGVRTSPEFERQWKGREVVTRLVSNYSDAEMTRRLGEIDAETLIVWGDNDQLVPASQGDKLFAALPNARYALIKDGGHLPMRLKPETFNRVCRDFLIGQEQDSELDEDLVMRR